ncbi:MAG: hypothetical protein WA667_11635 [Candidatus Nitrosopolaris sp.]
MNHSSKLKLVTGQRNSLKSFMKTTHNKKQYRRLLAILQKVKGRTGVRYHEVHVYRPLHKWRFKPSTTKEICQYSIKRRERRVQKKTKEIISSIPKDFTVALEDESIFIHDAFRRKMWTPEVIRLVVTITGHIKKLVYLEHYALMEDNSFVNSTFDQTRFCNT